MTKSSLSSSTSISGKLNALVYALAGYAVAGGMLTLIGWATNQPRLANWDDSGITMKPNAALVAFVAGAALLLRLRFSSALWPVRLLALVPLFVGTLTILEHLTPADFGIDTLLFHEPFGERATASPGRMGIPMSTSSVLMGSALLVSTLRPRRWTKRFVITAGLLMASIALLSLTGYIFQADPLFTITRLTAISLQAATIVLALGIGLVLLIPEDGPRRLLTECSATGLFLRWAFPLAVFIPIGLGYLRIGGEYFGIYDTQFGTALRTIAEVYLLVGLVWWGGRRLQRKEEALRSSERDLADFFENASVALHWVAPDGTILKANQAELDLVGCTREEYLGRNIAEFHVDQAVIKRILASLQSGQPLQQVPARLRRKDGSVRDVLVSSSAYFENGQFIHTRCFTTDVTDRRSAERAQLLLASIVEASDDAIIGKSLDGHILSWNQGAERLYGYTAEEAVGKSIDIIVPPNLRGEERSILDQLSRGKRIDHFETVRITKDGRRVHVSLTVSPLRDSFGNIIGASKIARDITERKLTESMLMEEKERVQVLADAVPALISYIDKDCTYRLVNQVYEKWFRKPRINIVGRHMREILGESAWTIVQPHVATALSGMVARFETKITYSDNPPRWIDVTYTPDRDIDGSVRGFVAHVNDITQRKKFEEELRVNQELAETLIQHLDVGAALIRGKDLRFLKINEVYQSIAPDREFLGKTLDEVWPEGKPFVSERCRHVIETGESFEEIDGGYAIQRSKGGPFERAYFTWSAHRVWLPGEQGWGVLLSVYETTRRKAIEAQLIESQRNLALELHAAQSLQELSTRLIQADEPGALYEGILDTAVAIMHSDCASLQLYHPERGEKGSLELLGYRGFTAEAAEFWTWVTVGSGSVCAEALRTGKRIIVSDVSESDGLRDSENGRIYAQTGIRAVLCNPLHSRSGRLLGMMSTHWRATHEPSASELRLLDVLARQAADLMERKQTEKSLYNLVERAPFGIYIVDSQFRIAMLNARSQARAFRNVNPAVGRDFSESIRVLWPEPVATEVIEHFRHTLDTGESYYSMDYIHPRADIGEVESYEWELHRITLPDGQHGVVCYYYESTQLRKAEQALRDSDRKKDEFIAILAHELRNPLAPLRNMLEFLKRGTPNVEHHHDALETMDRQLNQIVRLIDDLLDVSRISEGKIELRKTRTDLASIVRQAVETGCSSANCGTERVSVLLPEEPIVLNADPVRLTQVFANLLSNACKYTEPDGSIELSVRRDADEAIVSVKDTGIGIPPSELGEIFELFAQVDQSLERSQGGLGIGLTLAKRLVDLHGGTITAASEGTGKGSEFIVRLPIMEGAQLPTPLTQTNGEKAAIAPRRILVVDDNMDSARTMAMIMKLEGHETHVAFDGLEALESARSIRPDVALLDIGLPRLNGYDLCRKLRSESWGQDMVLIALTGWGQEGDRQLSKDAGFNAHLVKPVNPDDLSKVLEQFA